MKAGGRRLRPSTYTYQMTMLIHRRIPCTYKRQYDYKEEIIMGHEASSGLVLHMIKILEYYGVEEDSEIAKKKKRK